MSPISSNEFIYTDRLYGSLCIHLKSTVKNDTIIRRRCNNTSELVAEYNLTPGIEILTKNLEETGFYMKKISEYYDSITKLIRLPTPSLSNIYGYLVYEDKEISRKINIFMTVSKGNNTSKEYTHMLSIKIKVTDD